MHSFTTEGSAHERGRQHGLACRDLALRWMPRALDELAQRLQCASVTEAVARVEPEVSRMRHQSERLASVAMEECCGIAEGLGLDELTYFTAIFSWRLAGSGVTCSTLAWRDGRGRPMFAKTDDIAAHELGANVLQIAHPERGHRNAVFHFAGTPWTVAGMNDRGLAMGMTGIPGPTVTGEGCPSLMALHGILPTCATVSEAIECIREQKVDTYGYSLMLADGQGELALVEKNAAGTAVLAPLQGGHFAHTNHVLDPHLRSLSPEQSEPIRTNGVRRLDRIHSLAPCLSRDEHGLEAFISDRGGEGGIWQEGQDGLHTDFGVVCLPHARQMRFWTGHPSRVPAGTVELDASIDRTCQETRRCDCPCRD